MQRLTTGAHQRNQAADYQAAARIHPGLITTVDEAVATSTGDTLQRALSVQHEVYVATTKLVTRTGDGKLAWIAAERAVTAAQRAESPAMKATAAYQVAYAFLKFDQMDQAGRIAISTAEDIHRPGRQAAAVLRGPYVARVVRPGTYDRKYSRQPMVIGRRCRQHRP